MPVGYAATVWAPAETIAAVEFFFVDPVKRAIDHVVAAANGAVGGKLNGFGPAPRQFNPDVVVAHIRHTRAVG